MRARHGVRAREHDAVVVVERFFRRRSVGRRPAPLHAAPRSLRLLPLPLREPGVLAAERLDAVPEFKRVDGRELPLGGVVRERRDLLRVDGRRRASPQRAVARLEPPRERRVLALERLVRRLALVVDVLHGVDVRELDELRRAPLLDELDAAVFFRRFHELPQRREALAHPRKKTGLPPAPAEHRRANREHELDASSRRVQQPKNELRVDGGMERDGRDQ
mmetsp:Transcript_24936/g.77795  ORF Transcript_24936/g.77795 Transcript_24936/m.77795 type:complete len:220 (+) Transcript_24936:47-706(+)